MILTAATWAGQSYVLEVMLMVPTFSPMRSIIGVALIVPWVEEFIRNRLYQNKHAKRSEVALIGLTMGVMEFGIKLASFWLMEGHLAWDDI